MSNSLSPHLLYPTRFLCPWDFPCKNTGMGCHFLIQGTFPTQGIFLTQGSNPSLLHLLYWQVNSLPLVPPGKPSVNIRKKKESEVIQSCPTLCNPMDCNLPGSSIHGFSRQEYWSGLPLHSSGDLPNQGLNLGLLHCRQILYHLSYQGSPM